MPRYFKIGELAKLYHLNADTLRYYEDQGILSPTRAPNGYRLYSPQDVWRLNVIRDLRQLGIPLESIAAHLKSHSALSTLQLLETEEALLEKQLRSLEEMSKNVRRRKQALLAALHAPVGEIAVKTLSARPCFRISEGYRTDEEMDVLIQQLMAMGGASLYLLGNDEIGSFVSLPAAFEGIYREYDGVFALHKDGKHTIPAGQYLCISYRGDCTQNSTYIPMLLDYAAAHELYPEGPLLEVMRTDIHISRNPQEHITELQLRVVPDIAHAER